MKINFFPKIIFLFISIVLLFPKLHAEVKVLCLGEGECVGVGRNVVQPGSLSGTSDAEKEEFGVWKEEEVRENEAIIALNGAKLKIIDAEEALANMLLDN